jgi:hypothetical protein
MIMTIIFLFIAGLIFENASDSIRNSQGIISRILAGVFLFAFFAGAGFTADSNFNNELRIPLVAMNEKLDYVHSVDTESLSDYQQRLLRRYTKLDVDLEGERKLVIGSFDQFMSSIKVLINFEGDWVVCNVMSGRPSSCNEIK